MFKLIPAAIAVLAGTLPLLAQTSGERERFTAFAVANNEVFRGAGPVDITITRWSTQAEQKQFAETLKEKGPGKLLDQLQDARPVGYIRTPDTLGYELRYAVEEPGEDGGRKIVIATDRPISFWEVMNKPPIYDYRFTFIEMRINPDGTGEGKMSIATKIIAFGDVISLENYASQPVMLNQIRSTK
jgi:hypothetical protein